MNIPRLILAALSGGSGKTIVSLGLCRHFRKDPLQVRPFKKGPDYIDAAWMGRAAGHPSSNLDPFLMPASQVRALFWEQARGGDLAIIEGNRGLFDGKDVAGTCSTAELAKLLQTPVILIIDCTKMTRTVAALVLGCSGFDPDLHLAGVIFNQTAGERHRAMLTRSVEAYTDVPVLGALPKLRHNPIPERHMGLVSDREYEAEASLTDLGQTMNEWLDTDRILNIARSAGPVSEVPELVWPGRVIETADKVRIGVVRDAALWFYYEENFQALRKAGADVVEISLLSPDPWPELHGLYLGGGFPETQAETLSRNLTVLERIQRLAADGLPIYAECGGLMYLGESIHCNGRKFPMAAVLPFGTDLCAKPQGHGYTRARVRRGNPFHALGETIQGHEFHYSRISPGSDSSEYALEMVRGHGIENKLDGLISRNTFATYTHIHALGALPWAGHFTRAACSYKRHRQVSSLPCPCIVAEGDVTGPIEIS
ncbi:MAG: cobyrinate a,c-diamide synthase [Desulfovibrionales bacterium]